MAPILVATAPAQQQQQQAEGGPRRFERTWDPKCPIEDIMNTDMSPVLPKREFNPVIVPVTSPAPVGGSLLQTPPSPELSTPETSKIPGPSTMPEPSVTHPPPAMPRLNARGRKLLPDGPIKRRTQDLSTPQSSAQSSISAPKQLAALVLAPAAAAAPALASAATPAPASAQVTAQPAVVAVVNQKSKPKKENEKVRCTCSYCVEKYGPNGNMIAEKTWKEHKRADTTAKEGTVQDPKCEKCQKQEYVCIRKETGPCQVCMRMSDVCSFTGQSRRKRVLDRQVKVKKMANTVTDPPDDPATHQAGQKRGPESSFLDVKDDSQVPDLPVDFRQQAEPSIFKNKVEDIGESGSHASGSSGLGLRSRTLSISPPPVVRKRSDEVEENAGEDFGPRTKRRRIADQTD
ncbi:hypothetical protein CABS01_16119 [Colletotrichum abscissum]|uniref:Zn(2)-C6 fungal-type domain-containing protein n=1 Tax=Colletotrichum abscissum TaxID=1671311 RepID=A0A9Q0AVE7_9PEZI|nr:uncharacterized protein CABS01_16119 [Colletotrichum abscissum]KAI3527956.1 hypothetical protein CABS02_15241 [Colletotrichum abscissum]KAK1472901.1 hypothetical protein CABS01_16119 [Colletotrichum abscissum]